MTQEQKEKEYKFQVKQLNSVTREIIKTKRTIDTLGDNNHIINYLASLEYCRGIIQDKIRNLLA